MDIHVHISVAASCLTLNLLKCRCFRSQIGSLRHAIEAWKNRRGDWFGLALRGAQLPQPLIALTMMDSSAASRVIQRMCLLAKCCIDCRQSPATAEQTMHQTTTQSNDARILPRRRARFRAGRISARVLGEQFPNHVFGTGGWSEFCVSGGCFMNAQLRDFGGLFFYVGSAPEFKVSWCSAVHHVEEAHSAPNTPVQEGKVKNRNMVVDRSWVSPDAKYLGTLIWTLFKRTEHQLSWGNKIM